MSHIPEECDLCQCDSEELTWKEDSGDFPGLWVCPDCGADDFEAWAKRTGVWCPTALQKDFEELWCLVNLAARLQDEKNELRMKLYDLACGLRDVVSQAGGRMVTPDADWRKVVDIGEQLFEEGLARPPKKRWFPRGEWKPDRRGDPGGACLDFDPNYRHNH